MNRKERRVAAKRGPDSPGAAPRHGGRDASSSVADLMEEARRQYQRGNGAQAEALCRQILARVPTDVHSLNLIGVIAQSSGRHHLAIKKFAKAIALDPLNAACHYNIGSSYQALNRRDEAAIHFNKAIALGLSEKNIEEFILQNPVVASCLMRLKKRWPLPIYGDELFGADGIETVAQDIFLRCAMESILIRGSELEAYLTNVRSALLRLATINVSDARPIDITIVDFFCALARQCFINEYVFAQSNEDSGQAGRLRELLLDKLESVSEVHPLLLPAVAAYYPLHSLAGAEQLLDRDWPSAVTELLRQQVREPLEEQRDRGIIPSLTSIEDSVSLEVMRQYEENPFPRWTINPLAVLAGERKLHKEVNDRSAVDAEILIAGCGTGQHVFQIAQIFPEARVLAVDISRPSLAYARRKSREEGLDNVEYAQADIMKLGTIGRTFDRIEAVGVLHHLADPRAGWRVLLSLLRPDGEMHIGLYSEIGRRAVVAARALIAERGFRATAEDIRACRQEILREGDEQRWAGLTAFTDFYCMSGCRDLIFNVMEHRFTIPEIKAFLKEEGLSFLGFQLESGVIEKFQRQFPGNSALLDLDCWHAFETANSNTFEEMYMFSLRKHPAA